MTSLVGRRFGRLKVTAFAGFGRGVTRPYWCCVCDCGNTCKVEGRLLLGTKSPDGKHRQVSCGCARADPEVRREARMKVPKRRRVEICNQMRKSVKERKPAYSLDAHRAAELLGVSLERVEILARSGVLAYRYRKGELWVSSRDVSALIANQERNQKRCALELEGIARASAKQIEKRGTAK